MKHFTTSSSKLKKHSPGMPGITQSMGGSDSKYLKHCTKRGKGKGLSYTQQTIKNVGETNIKDTGLWAKHNKRLHRQCIPQYMCAKWQGYSIFYSFQKNVHFLETFVKK